MHAWILLWAGVIASTLVSHRAGASATDGTTCLISAERVDEGDVLSSEEVQEAHEACIRALAATGSVIQKYQFQEADFTITGKYHKF